jgi:predicted RNA binding protein YcfA (HicA-like mRNA interferase family)
VHPRRFFSGSVLCSWRTTSVVPAGRDRRGGSPLFQCSRNDAPPRLISFQSSVCPAAWASAATMPGRSLRAVKLLPMNRTLRWAMGASPSYVTRAARRVVQQVHRAGMMRLVKYRQLLRMLEDDGWRHDRTNGSHMMYVHPSKPGAGGRPGGGKEGQDVPRGTLNSILRQAGLK